MTTKPSNNSLLFLGTGASTGVPVIGCDCRVCTSTNRQNRRLRCSAVCQWRGLNLLIDVGPDFRYQALHNKLNTIDGLLLTHTHYDHIAGIDELRTYNYSMRQSMPCLLSKASKLDLEHRYHYLFAQKSSNDSGVANLELSSINHDSGSVEFLGVPIQYVHYKQGNMDVTGYIFDKLAYISDIRHFSDDIFDSLQEIDILVVSALRINASRMQFGLDEAIEFSKRTSAKQTWITHVAHDLDHMDGDEYLPDGMQIAYDGLRLSF